MDCLRKKLLGASFAAARFPGTGRLLCFALTVFSGNVVGNESPRNDHLTSEESTEVVYMADLGIHHLPLVERQ